MRTKPTNSSFHRYTRLDIKHFSTKIDNKIQRQKVIEDNFVYERVVSSTEHLPFTVQKEPFQHPWVSAHVKMCHVVCNNTLLLSTSSSDSRAQLFPTLGARSCWALRKKKSEGNSADLVSLDKRMCR